VSAEGGKPATKCEAARSSAGRLVAGGVVDRTAGAERVVWFRGARGLVRALADHADESFVDSDNLTTTLASGGEVEAGS
jgi:hypothetical protein